jgi:hypothetical protein
MGLVYHFTRTRLPHPRDHAAPNLLPTTGILVPSHHGLHAPLYLASSVVPVHYSHQLTAARTAALTASRTASPSATPSADPGLDPVRC